MARRCSTGCIQKVKPTMNDEGSPMRTLANRTRMVGAVYPPAEIRCIVDKTAQFVAQNGVEFEQRILSNEKRNPKFNFLKSKDAYHTYYQRRILEFLDQVQSPEPLDNQVGQPKSVGQ